MRSDQDKISGLGARKIAMACFSLSLFISISFLCQDLIHFYFQNFIQDLIQDSSHRHSPPYRETSLFHDAEKYRVHLTYSSPFPYSYLYSLRASVDDRRTTTRRWTMDRSSRISNKISKIYSIDLKHQGLAGPPDGQQNTQFQVRRYTGHLIQRLTQEAVHRTNNSQPPPAQ